MFYLAQSYTIYHSEELLTHPAYMQARDWVKYLWQYGIEVFSPILYTHPFHVALGYPNLNYVEHDLKMIAEFKDCTMIFLDDCLKKTDRGWCTDIKKSSGAWKEYIYATGHGIPTIRAISLKEQLNKLDAPIRDKNEMNRILFCCEKVIDGND